MDYTKRELNSDLEALMRELPSNKQYLARRIADAARPNLPFDNQAKDG